MKVPAPALRFRALCLTAASFTALCASALPLRAQKSALPQSSPPAALRNPYSSLVDLDALIGDKHPSQPSDRQPQLAAPPLTLDDAESLAAVHNPGIALAVRRVVTAQAAVPAAGALDDPGVMYRGWGIPLTQPWDYNAAQNMFMLTQALPGPGKRALRTGIAQSGVEEAQDDLANTRLQVRVQVRRAFYGLLRAQDELRVHDQHVAIARQAIQAARIRYTVGQVPQQDLLKAQLELTRLAEHMIRFERDAALARARLNTLIGRDPASPLTVRGDYGVLVALPSELALEKLALLSRPDLLEAEAAVEQSRRQQSLAHKAYVPDFTVSAGYMLMAPTAAVRNNYMVEGSMTLPWLNHRLHDSQIATSSAAVTEQEARLADLRTAAFEQIQESLAEARASQRFAALYQESLRPQAEATFHAAVIAYENNQADFLNLLDSQMTVIDIDLAAIDALADFSTRMADLELATGAPIPAEPAPNANANQNASQDENPKENR